MEHQEPVLSHAEPILYVQDVAATVRYWQEVLGFPSKWTWNDPPTDAGVSWHGVFIQFSQHVSQANIAAGYAVWIRVRHIETLYAMHQQRQADIVVPLRKEPWGMAQYTVKDINGYLVHFAAPVADRETGSTTLPSSVKILVQLPEAADYARLSASVGWSALSPEAAMTRITPAVNGVVAQDTESGEVIGCALLLGDHASYYYIKDVMVHPDWQRKGVGTALMQALTVWLNTNGADKALVSLITGETLEPFYRQFGFAPAFGMIRYVQR